MNSELKENLINNISERFDGLIARKAFEQEMDNLIKEERAYELTEEEQRLIKSFRQFKRTHSIGIFSWQIIPSLELSLPATGDLIRDPRDVSVT